MATRNDITGDSISSRVTTDAYRENFDNIFNSRDKQQSDDDTSEEETSEK